MTTLLRAQRLISRGDVVDDAWVLVDGDAIAATGTGDAPAADSVERLEGTLVPGFVDIHCHGAGGHSFDDGDIGAALAVHRAHGSTRVMLSLVTASIDVMTERVARAADWCDADPLALGIHLEGPFLDVAHCGAHDPALLVPPTLDAVGRLLDAGRGHVRQVTIAPELAGGLEAIAAIRAAGARVAVGHTAATEHDASVAYDAGATILTHAFNGMDGIHHRAPGPVIGAVDAGAVIEAIADGTHLTPRIVRMLFDLAPDRIALITDAMSATGQPDGPARIGSLAVYVTDGVPRLVDGGSIAGSTLTMDRAVQVATAAGVPLADAVLAATATPAMAIGRNDLGSLEAGFAADAVLLGDDGGVRGVWAAGERRS